MENLLLAPVHLQEGSPNWGWGYGGASNGCPPAHTTPTGETGKPQIPPFVLRLWGPPAAISSPAERASAEGRGAPPPPSRSPRVRMSGAAGAHARWRRRRLYIGAGGRRCRRIADGSGSHGGAGPRPPRAAGGR